MHSAIGAKSGNVRVRKSFFLYPVDVSLRNKRNVRAQLREASTHLIEIVGYDLSDVACVSYNEILSSDHISRCMKIYFAHFILRVSPLP